MESWEIYKNMTIESFKDSFINFKVIKMFIITLNLFYNVKINSKIKFPYYNLKKVNRIFEGIRGTDVDTYVFTTLSPNVISLK